MSEHSIVSDWLRALGLPQYAESFVDNGYDDLEICKQIGDADLDAIGVSDPKHRERVLQAVRVLLEQGGTAVYFTLEEAARHSRAVDEDLQPGPHNTLRYFTDEYEEGKAELVCFPKMQLKLLIRDKMGRDGIRLSSMPYTNPDGSRGNLQPLAVKYAVELRTHYQDVLDRLEELRRRRVAIDFPPLPDETDGIKAPQYYRPGKYMPSSCLQEPEDPEPTYGVYGVMSQHAPASSPQRYSRSKIFCEPCSFNMTECGTEGGRGKKGGFSRLFRTLGSKKDKSSPRHMARLRAGGAAKASDAPPTTGACLPPLQPGDVLLGDEHCVQLMLAVRDGQLTMEQAVQRLRQRDTLRLRNHKNRDEMLNEFARSLLWTQNATKKTQANSIFYTDSCGGMHEPPIYYEPPDASPDCGGGIAHSRRICGGVPAPTCSTTLPRSVVLASPFKPPVSSSSTTTYSKSSGTSEVCDGNCGNIMCSVRAAAESSPSPPAEGITVLGGADEEIETETGCCDTVPEEEVALRTVPDVAHESELKRAAAAAGSEGAREGSSATRQAPSRGTSASRASGGSGGMLGRLRNITSRSSYTSEEGQSQSSDYEDQEEVDKMSESQKSQEQHRNSLVGRVRHIHQDVKKKISKFRNSRNSIDGSITDDKDAAEDCLQPGSSIESIPSGSAGSRSSLQANTPSSSNRSSIGEEDCTQCVGPIVGRARALVDNTPSPYDKDALPFKKGDIIDILSKNTTGTWVGVAHKKVGHFKFITVEEIPDETKPRQRKFPSVPKLDRRPDNLEEMLQMFGLQDYLNVLMLHGYQDLDIFKEVVKDDLDSLGITNHEHQLLIFQLAEMLLEYDGETLGEYTEVPSSPTPPQEQPAADSTQAPINNLDGGTEADDPDIQQSVDSTVNGVLGYELNITVAEGEAVNEGGHNGQERRPIPRTFHQDFSTASREEEDTAGEQGLDERLSESPARIPLSYARKVKSSTLTRQDDAGGRKVTRPPSMPLRACIEHKLAAEGIDLCREPYTDLTGFCGIPPALVQRYSEELQRDVAEIANALDQVRITELGERGRHGIPNDFLADSCLGPIADADYSSLHSWLVSLGLPMYEPLFAESHITDIARVAELREADFRAMGIGNARHVRLLSSAVGAMHLEQSHVTFR